MKWQKINLKLSSKEIKRLKEKNKNFTERLEKEKVLSLQMLKDLKDEMTKIINKNSDFKKLMEKIENSGDHYVAQLCYDDNEILNLPWTIAWDKQSDRPISNIARLHLCRSLNKTLKTYENRPIQKAPPPLKILIMIASPTDSDFKNVLSYDKEEYQILHAFQNLMQNANVEVDFTEDGSLEALEEKIKTNEYHILHFSGHGIYEDGKGYLQLENHTTLKKEIVKAKEFAESLASNPNYKIPLVVLSSCQMGKGNTDKGLTGVTNQLLKIGIPAVVAMSMSIQDKYATAFSAKFYEEIAKKQNILSAFFVHILQ